MKSDGWYEPLPQRIQYGLPAQHRSPPHAGTQEATSGLSVGFANVCVLVDMNLVLIPASAPCAE